MRNRMHSFCRRAMFALALGTAVFGLGARATTLERMTLEKLTQSAQAIVRAKCLDNSTAWDGGEIWTSTSFKVKEVWKGSLPERFTVRLLGGRVGNITSTVTGIPRFRPGEEVVLFLETTPRGGLSVVSWQQGSFRIRRDTYLGVETLTQDTASFATFDPATRRFQVTGIRNTPLDAFHAQVDAALRAEMGRKP